VWPLNSRHGETDPSQQSLLSGLVTAECLSHKYSSQSPSRFASPDCLLLLTTFCGVSRDAHQSAQPFRTLKSAATWLAMRAEIWCRVRTLAILVGSD